MKIHYLFFEVSPKPKHHNFNDCGGAFINCWIMAKDFEEAESIASAYINSEGWDVIRLEEKDLPERDWYQDIPDSLEQFDYAVENGEAYITHTWPPEPQEDDIIH